jgi:hypothetical protein
LTPPLRRQKGRRGTPLRPCDIKKGDIRHFKRVPGARALLFFLFFYLLL